MWDEDEANGVLNDFDLAKLVGQCMPRGQIKVTGTLPFMALELLTTEGMQVQIPSLYRHEVESFTWVLIYLCYSVTKRNDGEFALIVNEYIKKWFTNIDPELIQSAKINLDALWASQDMRPLLYAKFAPLARVLHIFWKTRYLERELALQKYKRAEQLKANTAPAIVSSGRRSAPAPEPYKEASDETTWEDLVQEHSLTLDKENLTSLERLWKSYEAAKWPKPILILDEDDYVFPALTL